MSDVIIAAFIGVAGTIIGAIITHYLENHKKKDNIIFSQLSSDYGTLIENARVIRLYTVNSHVWYNQINMVLQQNPAITLDEVFIMVRKRVDETENDLRYLEELINNWSVLVERKRIKELSIIAYDHDPDHYYALFGDEMVLFGQVYFDDKIPTGTSVDYNPLVACNDTEIGREIIKRYQKHFKNVVERYKDKATLYITK